VADAFEAEIKKYTEQLAVDSKSRAFVPLSEIYRKLGRYDEAIAVAKEGLSHHPNYVGGKTTLARAYFENGEIDLSQELLENVLLFAPDNLLVLRILSQIYIQKHENSRALPLLKQLLAIAPADAHTLQQLQKMEPSKTISKPDEKTLVEENKTKEDKLKRLDQVKSPTVATEPVLSMPQAQKKEDSKSTQTATLANLYRAQGHLEQSIQIYRNLLKVDPKNSIYLNAILEMERELEKRKKSRLGWASKQEYLNILLSRIQERRRRV